MSVTLDISEREFRVMVIKMALWLATLFALIAVGVAIVVDRFQTIALGVLFGSLSFGFLTNGVLAILKIIDWFEARRGGHGRA